MKTSSPVVLLQLNSFSAPSDEQDVLAFAALFADHGWSVFSAIVFEDREVDLSAPTPITQSATSESAMAFQIAVSVSN